MNAPKLKLFLMSLSLLVLSCSVLGKTSTRDEELLIFEGTVIKVGELPAMSCGVMAVYQLARYRVDRVLVGNYKAAEITVDHLACKRDVLEGISSSDKVIVVINRNKTVLQRWNTVGIRSPSDVVKTFYVAERVARPSSCCDAK